MSDCTTQCLEKIKKQPPPGNRPCAKSFCSDFLQEIDQHCQALGFPAGTPILFLEPGLGQCYCCCDCLPASLAVAVGANTLAEIDSLKVGDEILAAGSDLRWSPHKVQFHSGVSNIDADFMCVVVFEYSEDDKDDRAMVVTPDHLFLMVSGKLKPAEKLRPGDEVRRTDGTASRLRRIWKGALPGFKGDVYQIHTGQFDGQNLQGHLIGLNGVVCADYNVQLHFVSEQLAQSLIET